MAPDTCCSRGAPAPAWRRRSTTPARAPPSAHNLRSPSPIIPGNRGRLSPTAASPGQEFPPPPPRSRSPASCRAPTELRIVSSADFRGSGRLESLESLESLELLEAAEDAGGVWKWFQPEPRRALLRHLKR